MQCLTPSPFAFLFVNGWKIKKTKLIVMNINIPVVTHDWTEALFPKAEPLLLFS